MRIMRDVSPLGRPPVMLDIVEEHFEELDFLWELREGVIFAPDWNLQELAELEERAEAHLDGLRLAELHAVDVARPHLTGDQKFAATAATFVFMETGEAELAAEVVKAFGSVEAPARDGIRIGLRHSRIDAIERDLHELARSAAPAVRAAAADVLAFHRRALPDIRALLSDEDDDVRMLAFGALGRGPSPLDAGAVTAGLRSKSPAVRRAVLEAAARSGTEGLDGICWQAASRPSDPDPEALAFLGVLGDARGFSLLHESLARPELAVAALRGMGALGRIEAIPLIIQAMRDPALAVTAGAAFTRITGEDDIRPDKPAPTRPADDAESGDDWYEDLLPTFERVESRWAAISSRFDPRRRWQLGREVPGVHRPPFETLSLEARRDFYLAMCANASRSQDLEFERRTGLQV